MSQRLDTQSYAGKEALQLFAAGRPWSAVTLSQDAEHLQELFEQFQQVYSYWQQGKGVKLYKLLQSIEKEGNTATIIEALIKSLEWAGQYQQLQQVVDTRKYQGANVSQDTVLFSLAMSRQQF